MSSASKISQYLELIPNHLDRDGCLTILSMIADNPELAAAPGSGHNHQAWEGGYLDHVLSTLQLGEALYPTLNSTKKLPFEFHSVVKVMFLHDLEKPWRHYAKTYSGKPSPMLELASGTKVDRKEFRQLMISDQFIELTLSEQNALFYVEGEGDDYRPDHRVMEPLACFCHMLDVASARIYHNEKEFA